MAVLQSNGAAICFIIMLWIIAFAKLITYVYGVQVIQGITYKAYRKIDARLYSRKINIPLRSIFAISLSWLPLIPGLLYTALFAYWFEHNIPAVFKLPIAPKSLQHILIGIGIAAVCVSAIFVWGRLAGLIEINRSGIHEDRQSNIPRFFGTLVDFSAAAVFEEIMMRGYVFYVLYNLAGIYAAIVGSSIIFSLAHLRAHLQVPLTFTVNAFIFGLLTAISRSYTGDLWLPIGIHIGWNIVMCPIFGLPYAGRNYSHGFMMSNTSGPKWLTGGMFSPDAGLMGTAGMTIAALVMLACRAIF